MYMYTYMCIYIYHIYIYIYIYMYNSCVNGKELCEPGFWSLSASSFGVLLRKFS